jgi:DNA repair exonuclease SbcCD nuclease subunit
MGVGLKIGVMSDAHAGYTRGTREEDGVNVREMDVLEAASAAIQNLAQSGVEAIVDLGDLFHVPAPKKRAILYMVRAINDSGLPFHSVNGNHTLVRTRSDLHIYDVLSEFCPRFRGYTNATFVKDLGAYLVPYGHEHDSLATFPTDTGWIGGHWAAENAGFPGEHVPLAALPRDIPTLLGHFHTRQIEKDNVATYIGATERFAWGEATNPTGAAVFDTDTKLISFIEHPTREWVDIITTVEEVQDALARDLEGKIVRVTVEATVPQYHNLDIKAIRELGKGALEFQVRRAGTAEAFTTTDHSDAMSFSLLEAWAAHSGKLPKSVRDLGARALASAGVGE